MLTTAQLYSIIAVLIGAIATMAKILFSRTEKRLNEKIETIMLDIATLKQDTNRRLELQDVEVDEVQRNYNAKFQKIYEKQDAMFEKLSHIGELIAKQAAYCKAVQESKKN